MVENKDISNRSETEEETDLRMAFRVSVERNDGVTKMILKNVIFRAGNWSPSL